MPRWRYKIYIGDLVGQEDEVPFTYLRDQIVRRFKDSLCYDFYRGDFRDLVEELADADDLHEFNWVLNDLYDWGDERHRLWIDTMTTNPEEVQLKIALEKQVGV